MEARFVLTFHNNNNINQNVDENYVPQDNRNAAVLSQQIIQSLNFPNFRNVNYFILPRIGLENQKNILTTFLYILNFYNVFNVNWIWEFWGIVKYSKSFLKTWKDRQGFLSHSGKWLPYVIPCSKFIHMLSCAFCGRATTGRVYKTDLKNQNPKHGLWPYSLFCNGTGASLFISQSARKRG